MAVKNLAKELIRIVAPALVKHRPIRTWPGWLGRTLDVKVPSSVIPKRELSPTGQANINILLEMIERTKSLPGDIADVGVFRGASTIGMALYLRQEKISKVIYAFDSFEGFPEEADADLHLGGVENEDRIMHGFSTTSLDLVEGKLKHFKLKNVILEPGFFDKVFASLGSADLRFCFVHLDVNLYDSYKQSLEFFYPRLVVRGIMLFDEYNDPPWPGCNKAVDEFLVGKPETLEVIERDRYQKCFFGETYAGPKNGSGRRREHPKQCRMMPNMRSATSTCMIGLRRPLGSHRVPLNSCDRCVFRFAISVLCFD